MQSQKGYKALIKQNKNLNIRELIEWLKRKNNYGTEERTIT